MSGKHTRESRDKTTFAQCKLKKICRNDRNIKAERIRKREGNRERETETETETESVREKERERGKEKEKDR